MMQFGSEDSLHTALSLLQTLGELLILLEDKELVFSEHIKDMAKKQIQAQSSQMCIKTLYLEAQPLQRLEVFLKGQDLSTYCILKIELTIVHYLIWKISF